VEPSQEVVPDTDPVKKSETRSYGTIIALVLSLPFPIKITECARKVMADRGQLSRFEAIFVTALTAEVNRELMKMLTRLGIVATEENRGWVNLETAKTYEGSSGLIMPSDLACLLAGTRWTRSQSSTGSDTGRCTILSRVRQIAKNIVSMNKEHWATIDGIQDMGTECEMSKEDLIQAGEEILRQSAEKLTLMVVDKWGQGCTDSFLVVDKIRLYSYMK
jgi:hypothetical protein